jgi:ABC-2 type transport system permease protein
MNKIWLIIQREYITRVRKKSFLVISLLAPLLIALTTVGIAKFSSSSEADVVAVHDQSNLNLAARLQDTDELHFVPAAPGSLAAAQAAFEKAKPRQEALLDIPAGFTLDNPQGIQILSKGNVALKRQLNIRKAVTKAVSELKMARTGIRQETIDDLQAKVELAAINLDEVGGKRNDAGTTTAIAYALSILVYMFIFIYGVQVMRGVSEEKSNRIMEVMISSVKPFQLMMGKILGIAGVVLTQFALWLVLSWGITTFAAPLLLKADKPAATAAALAGTTTAATPSAGTTTATATSPSSSDAMAEAPKPGQPLGIWSVLGGLPIGSILGGFMFFFLGGYLLYSSLFAAIGSAVDDQTDAQQFMFPVTIPLILSYIMSISVIINGDPNGPLAFWLSMVPLTSPIAMVMRLPFGVPAWQLVLSGTLLVLGFIGTTWVAARIYRVGILMYGKKVTYKELSKWMFYKG